MQWSGAAPVNYVSTLDTLNQFEGGAPGAVGQVGERIQFVNNVDTLLQVADDDVYNRVLGGLRVTLIRMNPTAVVVTNV